MSRSSKIVSSLLEDLPTVGSLKESPQYYPGKLAYQADAKFQRISPDNYRSYRSVGEDRQYSYVISTFGNFGFVFDQKDIAHPPRAGMLPVMVVALHDSGIKGYMQASRLRIREGYARFGVTTQWYIHYVRSLGGVVSDFEHLEGGKRLWRSFVRTAADNGLKISLVDTQTNEWTEVDHDTPEEAIWSTDKAHYSTVLVMESGE